MRNICILPSSNIVVFQILHFVIEVNCILAKEMVPLKVNQNCIRRKEKGHKTVPDTVT